jgi:hypothetical protein
MCVFILYFSSSFVGFKVLTAMVMKCSIFWDITPCSLLAVRICYMLHDVFLVGSFLDPEDGGDIFL